jgi:hypothetical protein
MKSKTLFVLLAAAVLYGCATQKMSGDQLARIEAEQPSDLSSKRTDSVDIDYLASDFGTGVWS